MKKRVFREKYKQNKVKITEIKGEKGESGDPKGLEKNPEKKGRKKKDA